MLGPASIGFHAKQLRVHMCARVCGCLHVCLFGVCRCRSTPHPHPPFRPGTADAQAIHNNDFSQARISSQKNNCTPNNAQIYRRNIPLYHKSCPSAPNFVASPSLVTGFVTSRPFCSRTALLFPQAHLLNGMDFLIVCFPEQIYLCSFFFLPKGSY